MTFNLETFCRDLTKLELGELRAIYSRNIPKDLTIQNTHIMMEYLNLMPLLPRQEWHDGETNIDDLYFVQSDEVYEVFSGERGGKHLLETFTIKGLMVRPSLPRTKTFSTRYIDKISWLMPSLSSTTLLLG